MNAETNISEHRPEREKRNSWPDMGRFTREPEEIIDGFADRWGCDTVEEALRTAAAAEGSTDARLKPRCPECGSTEVWVKSQNYNASHKINTLYKCRAEGCYAHFDNPVYPEEATDQ